MWYMHAHTTCTLTTLWAGYRRSPVSTSSAVMSDIVMTSWAGSAESTPPCSTPLRRRCVSPQLQHHTPPPSFYPSPTPAQVGTLISTWQPPAEHAFWRQKKGRKRNKLRPIPDYSWSSEVDYDFSVCQSHDKKKKKKKKKREERSQW